MLAQMPTAFLALPPLCLYGIIRTMIKVVKVVALMKSRQDCTAIADCSEGIGRPRGFNFQISAFLVCILAGLSVLPPLAHAGAANGGAARKQLVNVLAGMKSVQAIQSAFLCEKKLQVLRKPFFSKGIITIARPSRVRFATIWPYRSCYILNGRHLDMRNESNAHWSTSSVDSQPAIGIMMQQFAAWSLGNVGNVSRQYQVRFQKAPRPVPKDAPAGVVSVNHKKTPPDLELFTLRPLGGLLKEAIREIQLGFAASTQKVTVGHQAGPEQLKYIRIVAKNSDQSMFWLRHTRLNPRLAPKSFAPVGPP